MTGINDVIPIPSNKTVNVITVNNKKRRGILLPKINIFIEFNYYPKF